MVGIPYMCYGPTNIIWNSNESMVKYWSVYIKGCEVACLSFTSFNIVLTLILTNWGWNA